MTLNVLLSLMGFALVTSITPGPNNMMLLSSGATFGLRRTVPHLLGVALGFGAMAFAMGLGLSQLFRAAPKVEFGFKVVAALYMLWLAWKIAHAAAPDETGQSDARPITFLQAAAFQWVNPKAWAMALTAVSVYAASTEPSAIALVALVFVITNLPCVTLWAWSGQALRRWLTTSARLRLFNWAMAALLVASLWPVLV
ncbi:MAG: LysE family translocator [Rhodobacteraceae bacterium]|nr:LysE family translocator [Paracoccaceae bacterium]